MDSRNDCSLQALKSNAIADVAGFLLDAEKSGDIPTSAREQRLPAIELLKKVRSDVNPRAAALFIPMDKVCTAENERLAEIADPDYKQRTDARDSHNIIHLALDTSRLLRMLHPAVRGPFDPLSTDERKGHLEEQISRYMGQPEWVNRLFTEWNRESSFSRVPAPIAIAKVRFNVSELDRFNDRFLEGEALPFDLLANHLGDLEAREVFAEIKELLPLSLGYLNELVHSKAFTALCVSSTNLALTNRHAADVSF